MTVRIVGFARIRELVGAAVLERPVAPDARAGDVFAALAREFPALAGLEHSVRFVRDGAIVAASTPLRDGDELAILPPYGGG